MQRTALSALLLLLAASAAQAEVYKWVDANGNAHYTDKPPANQKTQTVDIRTQPSGTSPAAAPANTDSPLERQRKMLKVLDEDKAAKAEAAQKAAEEKQKRQMECARLKDQQRQFAQGGRFYTIDANGERIYKNDDEIMKQREQVNKALQSCR